MMLLYSNDKLYRTYTLQEQEESFQTLHESSHTFYRKHNERHVSLDDRFDSNRDYIKILGPAFRSLKNFIENTHENLIDTGLHLQLTWKKQLEPLLTQKLRESLRDSLKRSYADNRQCFNFSLHDVLSLLHEWNEGISVNHYTKNLFLELEGIYFEIHFYAKMLAENCQNLLNRNSETMLHLWRKRQEEITASPMIQLRFRNFVDAFPEENRTKEVYKLMRDTVIGLAPEDLRLPLTYDYKYPEVLISLISQNHMGEDCLNKICKEVWALTELDKLQEKSLSCIAVTLTSLNASERRDKFYRNVFGELQILKDYTGQLLIRGKGDWGYVARIFKERVDLMLFKSYKDFYQVLAYYNVNNLPKDSSSLNKSVASISEKSFHPNWKCDAHGLLVGQITSEIIDKYRYLLA